METMPDETTPSHTTPAAMEGAKDLPELTVEELRVLGSLVEKELTTPDQYPLTLNALVLACNQKTNREPVLDLDESTVAEAVTSSKTKGLVRFVHPSHGRSALRYAHILGDALDLSERQLALLAVLVLRGPQTLGELRARTERMTTFEDLDDLERELGRMNGLDPPIVERLARRPGQKEERYAHLLGGDIADAPYPTPTHATYPTPAAPTPTFRHARPAEIDLAGQLEELRADVDELKVQLADLRRQLGA
jgi:uncharacterized protein YceH (UPF0502 family)